jgi:hypothetical protein
MSDTSKVVLVSPFHNDKSLYPHLNDFLFEARKKNEIEYLFFPERGYWIEEVFAWPINKKKVFKWLSIVKKSLLLRRKYNSDEITIIAIDNFAYAVCCRFANRSNIILWSHDFVTLDKDSASRFLQKHLNRIVKRLLQARRKIIIQSRERLALFLETHGIDNDLIPFYLPVSLRKLARIDSVEISRIPILMQVGGINTDRSNSDKIIDWYQESQKFELILHGYFSPEIIQKLNSCKKVPLASSIPVESDRVSSIISKSDIGFVSYVATDANFRNIAYASGQVVEFLRCGKPLIVHGDTNLNQWVLEKGVGYSVENFTDLECTIDKMISEYPQLQAKALEVFSEELAINRYIEPLLHYIKR